MTNADWIQAISGDWSTAANWSTGIVPGAVDDVTVGLIGNYAVTVTNAATASNLTFDAPGAELLQSVGVSLTLSGALTVSNGLVVLDAANSIGLGVFLNGGTIAIGDDAALGSGALTMTGGALLGTADVTLGNELDLSGAVVIAAADGTTLELDGADGWSIAAGSTLEFGTAGQDGMVVWHTDASSTISSGVAVKVRGGMLQAADDRLFYLTDFSAASVTIDAGAVIDAAGFRASIRNLQGEGTVTNGGAAAVLSLKGGDFAGSISGALSLNAVTAAVTLTGTNSYSGTTTIDGTTLTLGDGGTSGSISGTSGVSFTVNGGTFAIDRSDAYVLANAISGSGLLAQRGTGMTTIETANSHTGGTMISAGTLAVGYGAALGSGTLTVTGGALLGTADVTLANKLALSGAVAIAAAEGKTLDLDDSTGWSIAAGSTLKFGAADQDGTVVWHTDSSSAIGSGVAVKVSAGTLQAGDDRIYYLTDFSAASVTIDAGAVIDAAGFRTSIRNLQGEGTVTNSGAAAVLSLKGGDFAGSISGALSLNLVTAAMTLTGTNSYSGTTTIDGTTLTLGDGGTSGSISGSGAVSFTANGGIFAIDRSDSYALTNAISGAGALAQRGAGTTTIDRANAYTGGTIISAGTLAIGNDAALGSKTLTMTGGTLLGAANVTLANKLDLSGAVAIAAADGTTLDLDSSSGWSIAAGSTLEFGAAGQDGTVAWHTNSSPEIGVVVKVRAGTLQAADDRLGVLLASAASATVDAGAVIDLAGFETTINLLKGTGTVTSSGSGAVLTLFGGEFAGMLDGTFALAMAGPVTLAGTTILSAGNATIGANAVLTNNGEFDLVSDMVGIAASGVSSQFLNGGLFEKTGGVGTSVVAAAFQNKGEVEVTSGSLRFTGGFTNFGIVKGLLSHSGSVWTVAANAPGQTTYFGGSFDNLFTVATAPTYIDGGAGTDIVELTAGMTLASGSLANVETVRIANGVTVDLSNLSIRQTIVIASAAGGGTTVIGTKGADTITGGAGNDTINGGTGADTMRGGTGNDTYSIDNAGDSIVEAVGGGTDTINSSVSYTLGAEIENLRLTGSANTNATGNSLANALTGNTGANVIDGGGGNDTLDGGAGADTMKGGLNNDVYKVDDAGDAIVESVGQGSDTVLTSVSYKLAAGQEIETFATSSVAGTAAITLTGNEFGQRVEGNNGNNILYGGAGNDLLVGYDGNDNIEGQNGADTLKGVSGIDKFVFRQSLVATSGADHISDFGADDFIYFDVTSGPTGVLNASAFTVGTNALDADDRFIYYAPYKALYYDPDGTGATAKVLFAVFDNGFTPTAADIVLF